jgi:hypothetical protein
MLEYTMAYEAKAVNGSIETVSGRHFAHMRGSATQRAFWGADLVLGHTRLIMPTITQAALLTRVSATYVCRAIKHVEDRHLIEAGLRSLSAPRSFLWRRPPKSSLIPRCWISCAPSALAACWTLLWR